MLLASSHGRTKTRVGDRNTLSLPELRRKRVIGFEPTTFTIGNVHSPVMQSAVGHRVTSTAVGARSKYAASGADKGPHRPRKLHRADKRRVTKARESAPFPENAATPHRGQKRDSYYSWRRRRLVPAFDAFLAAAGAGAKAVIELGF